MAIFQKYVHTLADQTEYQHLENSTHFSYTVFIWYFFSRNANKTHADQVILQNYLL